MDSVSIATSLVSAQQAQTRDQMQTKMTKMALQSDQAIVALLDQAAQSGAARSAPAGMGGSLDVSV
ncbi:hypothetical protein [Pannonibacter sp. SL95]|jgi:hypothetical protein|uniref:hypothetical protein n=1 Tax=Pannonibacter sp. SL95 TaxID=2995153 RepID=UPI0022756E19|nr:hypothetical protein [Pannonibacter sp. SL95]MCY1706737.1 hypothetical protein [Pannonibacter sp. SL95]